MNEREESLRVERGDAGALIESVRRRLTGWRYSSGVCPACLSPIHLSDCVLVGVMDDLAALDRAVSPQAPTPAPVAGGDDVAAVAREVVERCRHVDCGHIRAGECERAGHGACDRCIAAALQRERRAPGETPGHAGALAKLRKAESLLAKFWNAPGGESDGIDIADAAHLTRDAIAALSTRAPASAERSGAATPNSGEAEGRGVPPR